MIWFAPGSAASAEDDAKRFSELSKNNRIGPVIDALRSEFDFIGDLSIEYFSGTPMLFASVRGKARRMPVGLVSDGVNKLLAILIAIAYYERGAVLIDEIEDGFYFDRLPSIWKTIRDLSRRFQTQLFISTHSGECLRAIRGALSGHESDFRLLRAERLDEECTVTSIEGDLLEAALEQEIEVR